MSSDFRFICNLTVFVFYWFDYRWIKKIRKSVTYVKKNREFETRLRNEICKRYSLLSFHVCVEWDKRSVRVRVFVEVKKIWELSVFLNLNHFVAIGFYYRVVSHLICGILNFFVAFQLYEGISFMKCLSKLLLWIFIRCIKY